MAVVSKPKLPAYLFLPEHHQHWNAVCVKVALNSRNLKLAIEILSLAVKLERSSMRGPHSAPRKWM